MLTFMMGNRVFAAEADEAKEKGKLQDDRLPEAISCYQKATNAEDIKKYMACFSSNPTMIDVSRTFKGRSAIRKWALREVIPSGESFNHRKILEMKKGYAKTEVKWLSWVVHYYYWWNKDGKITKMSLQYAD